MTGEDRRELEDKLEHARGYLRDAKRTRAMVAGALADDSIAVPEWFRMHLETELHVADQRVALWRDVEADLHKRTAER